MTTSAPATRDTAATIARFNDAFRRRDKDALTALVHEDCLMVSAQPAPDGTAYVGKEACVTFWAELMDDESTTFADDDHRTSNRHWESFERGETFSGVDSPYGVRAARAFSASRLR